MSRLLGAYNPVGWWLLEAEYTMSGLDPWGYHFTSLIMHACCAVAIYALAIGLLPKFLPNVPPRRLALASALGVAAFIIHPMRTEPVAWVSSQSYLPCAILTILSVIAYLRSREAEGRSRVAWYVGSISLFIGALGAKAVPMALPFVLLILDFAALRRFDHVNSRRRELLKAVVEKSPYFLIGIAFALAAVWARSTDESLATLSTVGIPTRLAHMCYSLGFYAIRMIAPFQLHACYPMHSWLSWSDPRLVMSSIGFVAVVAFAIWQWKPRPWIGTVLACYFVILLPNSGLVRNTTVLTADRYGYLSTIPLFLALAGGLATLGEWLRRRSVPFVIPVTLTCGVLTCLVIMSRQQARTWHDSVSLWTQSVAAETTDDPYHHSRLGRALIEANRIAEAELELKRAVAIDPDFAMSQGKLGLALLSLGRPDEAAIHLTKAISLAPRYAEARVNLGYILAQRGQLEAAESEFAEAARIVPNLAKTHANLGAVRVQQEKFAQAASAFRDQIQLEPTEPEAHANLGYALINLKQFAEAANEYTNAVELNPDNAGAHHNLGHCLASLRRYDEAERHYREALRLDPQLDASRHGLSELLAARAGRHTIPR